MRWVNEITVKTVSWKKYSIVSHRMSNIKLIFCTPNFMDYIDENNNHLDTQNPDSTGTDHHSGMGADGTGPNT